jgi:hypothetical protein
MSVSDCLNNPWHEWGNGLTCRWCAATRTPAEAIVSGLASRRGGTEVLSGGARLLEDAACDADWTRTPDFCAGLRAGAELLLANTREGEEATAEAATATPFFQPGHTYTREHHGDTIHFLVKHVSTSPDGRCRVAHGWRNRSWDPGWEPSDSDDFTLWADVTEAGDGRG